MLLTAVSAVVSAADARGQEFEQQPLPSFYAGRPAGMSSGDLQTAPAPAVVLAQDGGRGQGSLRDAAKQDIRPEENAKAAELQRRPLTEKSAGPKADWAQAESDAAAEHSEQRGQVYDGLPVDGRERRAQLPPFREHLQPPRPAVTQPPHEGRLSGAGSMLHAGSMQRFLELIKENCELKAQLKIQQIEFEAKQALLAAERAADQQRRESERQIDELKARNAELQQTQQTIAARAEKQMQEMRNQMLEHSREMQRAQQGKAELEHRARALEAQLDQMKANHKTPVKRDEQGEEEPQQKREVKGEAARKQVKHRERARMHGGEGESERK